LKCAKILNGLACQSHRVDICPATGLVLHLTADHDGVLVDDVVREWASRHDQSYVLQFSGPAGDRRSTGTGDNELELDAVQFRRVVSGRERGYGLLAVRVPFSDRWHLVRGGPLWMPEQPSSTPDSPLPAGTQIVSVLTALPALFVDRPALNKLLLAIVLGVTLTAVVLMLTPSRHDDTA
jgi:hypothetical protein